MAMQQQYRDPPPYPGHSKQPLYQPGGRQSFSGSETSTDVSVSSMENLATSIRQEPQGEENQSQNLYNHLDLSNSDGGYSILARLGMPTSCVSDTKLTSVPAYFVPGPPGSQVYTTQSEQSTAYTNSPGGQLSYWQTGQKTMTTPPLRSDCSRVPISTYHGSGPYVNSQWAHNPMDISHNQQMMSYLANLPPPPEYPGPKLSDPPVKKEMCHAFELIDTTNKAELSRSQPDLSRLPESLIKTPLSNPDLKIYASSRTDMTCDRSSKITDIDQSEIVTRATQLVEMLSKENRNLVSQMSEYTRKISKLQKLELEIEKVHGAYESLAKSAQKREKLDMALKQRLEVEIKKLQTENKDLKDQIDKSMSPTEKHRVKTETEIKSKLSEKDTTIIKLLSHNKDLLSTKDKLEQQIASLKSSVIEQRAQIDILDNALTTVQANVHLEDESGKKEVYGSRVDQLQKAFASLQTVSERREQKEKQLRLKLEKEIETLKKQLKASGKQREDSNPDTTDAITLKRMINERDAKILQLETELVKWEQKWLEEITMRQFALQDNSPKFADIEKSSADAEKLINEAKTEKLRHMEELYQANRRVAELEARVQTLQSQLSEKEAMVKVYQRSPLTRSSSVQMLCCSPLHSPRPSLLATPNLSSHQSSHSDSSSYARHVKTGSESALDTDRRVGELREKLQSIEIEYKAKTEDECQLWQV
ncbi:angiomotin isoform X2 [Patella vulgata]|uniref:angiomotin isoform X2 n=1 Tax=Patella vulgata TaxID=6465 RepID=UPI00217FF546|nr:angiomotin isoform X2 [Patella vulgata]